jgi:WD40 repeat protein
LLTGSDDYTVKLWDVQRMERPAANAMDVGALPIAHDESADEAHPDEAANEVEAGTTKKAKEILSLIGHTREVTSVVFSPRGDRVLTSSRDGKAILWLAREDLDRRQVLTP